MNNKYKKLILNTVIFAIGSFGSKIISFFLVPVYTNIFSTAEYGTADLVATISNMLLPIFSLTIGESILYFGLKDKENNKKILLNGFFVMWLGAIAMLLTCPLLNYYSPLKGYALFIAGYTILLSFRLSLQYYTKANEKNLIFSIDSIIYAILICCLNIVFLVVLKMGVNGYLLALLLSEFISIVFLSVYNKVYKVIFHTKLDFAYLKKMVIYSAPLIINAISWSIAHSTDKIMIEKMISIESVGIYTVSTKIPTLVNVVTNFFCQAWTMSAILEYEKKDKNFYKNSFSIFMMVLSIAVACILLVLKPFMQIYVGDNFVESWQFVPFLLLAAVFQNFSNFFGAIIQSAQKSVSLMISSLVSCVVNVGLNLILIPRFGIQGAVIGTFGSYISVGILRMIISLKFVPFNAHILRLIISLLLLTVQCIVVLKQTYVWLVSAVVIVILLALYFKEFKTMVKLVASKIVKKKA